MSMENRQDLLAKVGADRRDFLRKISIAAAFAAPTIATFSLDGIRKNAFAQSTYGLVKTEYLNPGGDTYLVPQGVTSITVKMWGAGGNSVLADGGGGGYVSGIVAVTPGETLDFDVGEGGIPPNVRWGGHGGGGHGGDTSNYGAGVGGASWLRRGATILMVAAGGGGAGGVNEKGGLRGRPCCLGWRKRLTPYKCMVLF